MNARFKQAVSIDGKVYKLGINEVSKEVVKHPHFQRYVDSGWITDLDSAEPISQETTAQRNKRLHDKITAEAEKKRAPETDDADFGEESESEDDESSEPLDDDVSDADAESEEKASPGLVHEHKKKAKHKKTKHARH